VTDNPHARAEAGPGRRSVEIGVGLAMMIFAGLIVAGSLQSGIGWGAEGPKAGFFPFYVGLAILVASLVNVGRALWTSVPAGVFADWGQLRQVLMILVPTAIYVAAVPTLGTYVSSMLLIGAFMKWLGHYPWRIVLPVAFGVPALVYFMFEKWFLVSLPKGPIEELLGL
jgi:putative tricarboxylic transport membrane protein